MENRYTQPAHFSQLFSIAFFYCTVIALSKDGLGLMNFAQSVLFATAIATGTTILTWSPQAAASLAAIELARPQAVQPSPGTPQTMAQTPGTPCPNAKGTILSEALDSLAAAPAPPLAQASVLIGGTLLLGGSYRYFSKLNT